MHNNSNGGRGLFIVLVQRTLSLVHKTHHLAPQQLTSLKPIRPTTVFTRIGFHQRVATVQCTQVIYIWVVLCCFLRDRELDKGRSNFSFWDNNHCRYLKMIFKYVQTLMNSGVKTICYLCEQTSELKYHTYCVWKIIQVILNQLDTNSGTSSIIDYRKHCYGVSVD